MYIDHNYNKAFYDFIMLLFYHKNCYNTQDAHTQEYMRHVQKALLSQQGHGSHTRFSTYFDASGSFGLCHFPHLATQHADEPQRKHFLKISCMFKKVNELFCISICCGILFSILNVFISIMAKVR